MRVEGYKTEKCIVNGCENHQGEGHFVGALCSPCYMALTSPPEKVEETSQVWRNAMRMARLALERAEVV